VPLTVRRASERRGDCGAVGGRDEQLDTPGVIRVDGRQQCDVTGALHVGAALDQQPETASSPSSAAWLSGVKVPL
jgi:hypothetical protein